MKPATFATLLLAPLLLGACDDIFGDDDEGEVELSVEGAAFIAGDDLDARVHNGTDESVFYNLCFLQLDARAGDDWVETDYLGDLPCPAIDPFWPGLAPGRSSDFAVALSEDVPAGTYRLRLNVSRADDAWEDDDDSNDATTRAFEVIGPGTE